MKDTGSRQTKIQGVNRAIQENTKALHALKIVERELIFVDTSTKTRDDLRESCDLIRMNLRERTGILERDLKGASVFKSQSGTQGS